MMVNKAPLIPVVPNVGSEVRLYKTVNRIIGNVVDIGLLKKKRNEGVKKLPKKGN